MSGDLHYNLTSGSSYMTQYSDDPEAEGEIIYNNLTAVAEILFGEEYTDDDMEIVIVDGGAGYFNPYDPKLDAEAAAKAVDARAKRSGGTGWL